MAKHVNPNFYKAGGREQQALAEQKGKGTRAVVVAKRDASKKK